MERNSSQNLSKSSKNPIKIINAQTSRTPTNTYQHFIQRSFKNNNLLSGMTPTNIHNQNTITNTNNQILTQRASHYSGGISANNSTLQTRLLNFPNSSQFNNIRVSTEVPQKLFKKPIKTTKIKNTLKAIYNIETDQSQENARKKSKKSAFNTARHNSASLNSEISKQNLISLMSERLLQKTNKSKSQISFSIDNMRQLLKKNQQGFLEK